MYRPTTREWDNLALSQFFQACNASYRRADFNPCKEGSEGWNDDEVFLRRGGLKAWAELAYKHLNNSRSCPLRSQLSLKIVLRWSTTTITIVTAIPLLLSFVVEFCNNYWKFYCYDGRIYCCDFGGVDEA